MIPLMKKWEPSFFVIIHGESLCLDFDWGKYGMARMTG